MYQQASTHADTYRYVVLLLQVQLVSGDDAEDHNKDLPWHWVTGEETLVQFLL